VEALQLPQAPALVLRETEYRRSAGTRSWSEAEDAKGRIEDSYRSGGRTPVQLTGPKAIKTCVESFAAAKESQRITAALAKRYRRNSIA
jgi:hypothetical protein